MDGEDRFPAYSNRSAAAFPDLPPDFDSRFVAAPYRALDDAADRKARIAKMVATEIVPRLKALPATASSTSQAGSMNIAELARLVLIPDEREAAAYVTGLRDSGLSTEMLLGGLIEPAARLLGELWDRDEVDFIDVTLGVARLQALLSLSNGTHKLATRGEFRSVLMLTMPGEQHSLGIAMVEQFLEAGGWQVTSEREAAPDRLVQLVGRQWFAVAGIALSNDGNLDAAASAIARLREKSCNKSIGIMVGGPVFSADPGLARAIGADGTATSGPMAVVLAQKLLDAACRALRAVPT